jgi:septum formation protein
MKPTFLYLASQSPRRRQLLEQLGVKHELLLPDRDEDTESLEAVLPGEAPARYVRRVTGLKLDAALERLRRRGLPPAPVLCSDTTLARGRTK